MPGPRLGEAIRVWWRIGWLSFGGPAGQIALMHRILVDEKGWIDEKRYLRALNFCMLLPGPEAQQLATYVGWMLHGVRGGLIAGVLFILPGALVMLALSFGYVLLADLSVVEGLFFGLKAAVLAIVVQALLRIAGRALHGGRAVALAVAGFIALYVFNLPFPLVVLLAGLVGFAAPGTGEQATDTVAVPDHPGTLRAAGLCALLWLGTVVLLYGLLGSGNVFSQIAGFFSTVAVVTFGGAYAVLSYIAQQGVEVYGWLAPGEMLDGLGLAETTPGPLILVTQFVGFLGALRAFDGGDAWLAAVAGGLLTTWVLFLPSFVWIFAGAPWVERLQANRRLAAALAAITATVIGVIANLALWFAMNYLFSEHWRPGTSGLSPLLPVPGSIDWGAVALSLLALLLVFAARLGVFPVLALCALLGVLAGYI